jgi:hypothetical protein
MSNKKLLKEIIKQVLDAINEEQAILWKYEGQIPQIEVDLIMENIRKLYDNFHLLNKENQKAVPSSKTNINIGFTKKSTTQTIGPETEDVIEPIHQTPDEIVLQVETIEKKPAEAEPINEIPDSQSSSFDLFSEGEMMVVDKYKTPENTVHDNGSKEVDDDSIASKIQYTPINDLKAYIGINDRFIFINELFHGNMNAYSKAIDDLNSCENSEGAIKYLGELKEQNNINEELDSFRRLYDFVQRKYL